VESASVEQGHPRAQPAEYRLEDQVGFLVRRVHQRATSIFNRHFSAESLSPVQFAALIKIHDEGRISQNQLGRLINLDPATAMGVVSRLTNRHLVRRIPDPTDKRRMLLSITSRGLKLVEDTTTAAHAVTTETLSPLDANEQVVFLRLLSKLL
jgi:DNA-binding MarR family transcriptional regulator